MYIDIVRDLPKSDDIVVCCLLPHLWRKTPLKFIREGERYLSSYYGIYTTTSPPSIASATTATAFSNDDVPYHLPWRILHDRNVGVFHRLRRCFERGVVSLVMMPRSITAAPPWLWTRSALKLLAIQQYLICGRMLGIDASCDVSFLCSDRWGKIRPLF